MRCDAPCLLDEWWFICLGVDVFWKLICELKSSRGNADVDSRCDDDAVRAAPASFTHRGKILAGRCIFEIYRLSPHHHHHHRPNYKSNPPKTSPSIPYHSTQHNATPPLHPLSRSRPNAPNCRLSSPSNTSHNHSLINDILRTQGPHPPLLPPRNSPACLVEIHKRYTAQDIAARCIHGVLGSGRGRAIRVLCPCGELCTSYSLPPFILLLSHQCFNSPLILYQTSSQSQSY